MVVQIVHDMYVSQTWKACRIAIMKKFLTKHAEDNVMVEWCGLHLKKGEPIKKYIDRFWDLHLKTCIFKDIGFHAQKQQYCAGFPKDMLAYINAQHPKKKASSFMLAHKIFNPFTKTIAKPNEKDKDKTLVKPPNGKKNGETKKKKKKGPYKGPNKVFL